MRVISIAALLALASILLSAAKPAGLKTDWTLQVKVDVAKIAAQAKMTPEKLQKEMGLGDSSAFMLQGKAFWTDGAARVDISDKVLGEKSVLLDMAKREVFELDHAKHLALFVNEGESRDMRSGLMMLAVTSALNWDKTYSEMKQQQGAAAKELGAKTVNGEQCHGFQVTGKGDKNGGGWTTTAWVSDRLQAPVRIQLATPEISAVYDLTGINDWTVDRGVFAVPKDYKVKGKKKAKK
jgi:hypothetical protein